MLLGASRGDQSAEEFFGWTTDSVMVGCWTGKSISGWEATDNLPCVFILSLKVVVDRMRPGCLHVQVV